MPTTLVSLPAFCCKVPTSTGKQRQAADGLQKVSSLHLKPSYVLPAGLEVVRVPKLASCQEGNAGVQQSAPAHALQDLQAADLNTCTETSTDSHHGDIVCLQAGGQQGVRLRMVKKGSHLRVTASDPSGSQAPRILEVPIDSFVDESSGEPLSRCSDQPGCVVVCLSKLIMHGTRLEGSGSVYHSSSLCKATRPSIAGAPGAPDVL